MYIIIFTVGSPVQKLALLTDWILHKNFRHSDNMIFTSHLALHSQPIFSQFQGPNHGSQGMGSDP